MWIAFVFSLLAFCGLVARLDRFFYKANDSFCFAHICINSPLTSEWQTSALSSNQQLKVQDILSQPFHYWTKGSQSYVFLSSDGCYVLKFYRKAFQAPPSKKLTTALSGSKYAFEDLQPETHLLSVHQPLNQTVRLIDKLGTCHNVDLAKAPWVLQERAERFFTLFDPLVSQDPAKARLVIEKTIRLFKQCWDKDYIDQDAILDVNFGLIGDSPMILDVGSIQKGAQQISLRSFLLKMTESLGSKLQTESPPLYHFYLDTIDTISS